jgi:hypothetical protein
MDAIDIWGMCLLSVVVGSFAFTVIALMIKFLRR